VGSSGDGVTVDVFCATVGTAGMLVGVARPVRANRRVETRPGGRDFVGTSSGLNVAGAIALARELGPGKTVVTVAADTGLKYLAGDLFHQQA
jgi:cysteine synthase